MPPFLSEQWASAYFQVLFSVLVFAVGIPFLGLQLVMQEDVRHVVKYRTWKIALWGILVIMLMISVSSFIWILHPGSPINNPQRQNTRVAAQSQNTVNNMPESNSTDQSQETNSTASPPTKIEQPESPANEASNVLHHYLAGIIMTIIPIAALIFAYWLPTNYTRKNVINQFREELLGNLTQNRLPKRNRLGQWVHRGEQALENLRRKGYQTADSLSKLVYLGEHGNPGIEKNLVLHAFRDIADGVQGDQDNYKGRELSQLIRSFGPILENGVKPGNDENYQLVATILKSIWSKVSGKHSNLDATVSASMLKKLGLNAIKSSSDETAHLYIKHAAECDDSIVFELGVAALNRKRFRIALDALNKLEVMTLAENNKALESTETTKNLLGLLSHFLTSGIAAKRRGEDFLLSAKGSFSPSMERCLSDAVEYHYEAGNFETVEKLAGLSDLAKRASIVT